MKLYKYLILLSLLIASSPTNCRSEASANKAFVIKSDNGVRAYSYVIPAYNAYQGSENLNDALSTLEGALFSFPLLLETAVKENAPVILVIPDNYATIHPVCTEAPWVEGARVALTWASAFFRFENLGNIDAFIITYQPEQLVNEETLLNCYASILSQAPTENDHTEAALNARILPLRSLEGGCKRASQSFAIEPYEISKNEQPVEVITPEWGENASKRVVITGGAGFIGSHLAEKLLNQGYSVLVLDNFECSVRDNVKALESNPRFQLKKFDVTVPFDIEGPVDYIVHLASLPSPAFYYTRPLQTLKTGLHGTKNCLELAAKKNARFLFTSTSEVYGDPEISPQVEEYPGVVNPIGKRSQYDESKRGAETLIKLYFEKYGFDARIVRIFNTYGPHMMLGDGRVVTNFIRALLSDRPVVIYGDGKQTRSFAYVSDTVEGIFRVLESSNISDISDIALRIFNIGTPKEFTINELAERTNELSLKHFERPTKVDHIPQFDLDDPKMRKPDITRANRIVGFDPIVPLAEGLETTLLYFLNKDNARALENNQQ